MRRRRLQDRGLSLVGLADLTVYTRQMATLLAAGIPIIDALKALEGSDNPLLSEATAELSKQVNTGAYLSHAMRDFPRVYSDVYVGMVQIGEQTGQLAEVFDQLAGWLEKDHRLSKKVTAALTYPTFTFSLAVILTLVVFQTVLPGFKEVLEGSGVEMPWMTQVTFFLVQVLRNPLFLLLVFALILEALYLRYDLGESKGGRLLLARFYRKIPIAGALLWDTALARYCNAIKMLLSMGAPLTQSLTLAGRASGNEVLVGQVKILVEGVKDGETLSEQMDRAPGDFPPTLRHMVRVGEETSKLETVHSYCAAMLESSVENRVEALAALVEPVLLTGVAVVVGFTLVSIMLPLYKIMETVI